MDKGAECYSRYLSGDDSGLAEIITMYSLGISLYINTMIGDICLSEEIMQETFVKLAVKKPHFSAKSSFKTWLFTIARNRATDHLRYRKRFSSLSPDELFLPSDEEDIEKQYIKEEQRIELHKAMKRLNPEYSQALYLMYFEDMKTEEISSVMHRSKRSTGDLIYRAKKALKAELERAGFEYEII